jgi:hypothetical protein
VGSNRYSNYALLYKPKGWLLRIQAKRSRDGCEAVAIMALVRGSKKRKKKGGKSYAIMMFMFMFTPIEFEQLVGFL